MALITGSEVLAKCLKKEGVEELFFIMGGPMLLAEATCVTEGIRMIDVRHEQAAAFMGQAYSRLRQKPAVCMAASGPGVTNLITGVANALIDCCPVIAIGGSSPISQFGRQVFQEIDQVELMRGLREARRSHPQPQAHPTAGEQRFSGGDDWQAGPGLSRFSR
jgi:thiamine pyrophosphate-dependent acetolactate synthase large subunit-like protein